MYRGTVRAGMVRVRRASVCVLLLYTSCFACQVIFNIALAVCMCCCVPSEQDAPFAFGHFIDVSVDLGIFVFESVGLVDDEVGEGAELAQVLQVPFVGEGVDRRDQNSEGIC